MAKEVKKIAILRKMTNLENDDRIRKEFGSLTVLFPNISFKCFVMYPENREFEGITSYGLPFKSIYVRGREKYASGKQLIAKSWDYYRAIKNDIEKFDIIWCSGDAPTPTLLFIHGKIIVWDLRELPLFLMGSKIKQSLLKYIFNKCTICLHANQYRIDYLAGLGLIENYSKHVPVRNFPDYSTFDSEYDERYEEVKDWIAGRKCIYLQGINAPSRASKEVLTVIMETLDICAIVLGVVDVEAIELMKKQYGNNMVEQKICVAGNFPILKVPQYMKLCCASMIFYKNTSPNNWLCEANRLYQAIDMGLPVIVGSNPPMKSIVENLSVGISIDTDGSDVEQIKKGLSSILERHDALVKNIANLESVIHWDSQEALLKTTFEGILL